MCSTKQTHTYQHGSEAFGSKLHAILTPLSNADLSHLVQEYKLTVLGVKKESTKSSSNKCVNLCIYFFCFFLCFLVSLVNLVLLYQLLKYIKLLATCVRIHIHVKLFFNNVAFHETTYTKHQVPTEE